MGLTLRSVILGLTKNPTFRNPRLYIKTILNNLLLYPHIGSLKNQLQFIPHKCNCCD